MRKPSLPARATISELHNFLNCATRALRLDLKKVVVPHHRAMPLYELLFEHPTPPLGPSIPVPGLVDPPWACRPMPPFERFRSRTVLPMLAAKPGDPFWTALLRHVEDVLAWRATVPPEDRFWRQDAAR